LGNRIVVELERVQPAVGKIGVAEATMRKITQKVTPPPHAVEQSTVPADDHRSAYPFDKKKLLSSHPFFSNFRLRS
jgi:hypothetical protein